MALPADYISGTITLTNGSPDFTGTGTGWQAADFREGDILLGVEDHAGQVYVIEAITGNAAGTLTQAWAGTSGTYTYRMRYEWDSSRVSAQARAMVELLGNGNLESIASLTGPGVVVLEGPHSAGIRPFSDFINGVAYNVQVDTLADRATYDGQTAGFAVLVSDVGDGRSALFTKVTNASGDWTDPAYITGTVGPPADVTVGSTTTLPPGSAATVTPTPTPGGVELDFGIPAGEGFYWAGVYDIASAYDQDDVVRHNGSAFIALQAVPAGTNPSNAFPPVDTVFWAVLAAKGQDGTGTGIVQTVVAGEGIVVDSSDPANPIVSGGVVDGDKGDITVSDSGTVWGINGGVVAGVLYGLTLANDVTFPDHGIIIANGSARSIDDTSSLTLAVSKLKRMNLAWNTGTGGLDTGTLTASTGYHVFVIYNPTTDDTNVIASTSATNPLVPPGYTRRRRIGAFLTDASGIIRPFVQAGGWFMLKTPISLSTGWGNIGGGSAALKTTGVPLGTKMRARITITTTSSTAGYVAVSDPDLGAPTISQHALYYQPISVLTGAIVETWTSVTGQVYAGHSGAGATTANILLLGWYDIRDTSV